MPGDYFVNTQPRDLRSSTEIAPRDAVALLHAVDLIGIYELAKRAGRLWPRLAPNGGRRWTAEDDDHTFSLILRVMESTAYRRIAGRVPGRAASRYLLASVRNELLKARRRDARIDLVPGGDLESLPAAGGSSCLGPGDATRLARQVAAMLTDPECDELERRLLLGGPGAASARETGAGPSRATRVRRWRRVLIVLRRITEEAGLDRAELGAVLDEVHTLVGARSTTAAAAREP